MPFPKSASIEMPILQELSATGGAEDVRFLYELLTAYFPQLSETEIRGIRNGSAANWRKLVQKAGRELDERGLLERNRGFWKLTEKGRREVAGEIEGFQITRVEHDELNHVRIQEMLVEIGKILGFYAETEFEFYDVVWREKRSAQRLSHIFEVQSKGNIDSAFAKLKRAHDAQRTKPFLVLASERDTNRARQSLEREFHELAGVLTILSFAELNRIHQNLRAIAEILPKFLEK
jgi:Mrr N-terminal domain